MGTDIYLNVEVRDQGQWVSADIWKRTPRAIHKVKYYYWWRNYTLFAILANVRNREGLIPISKPRGLPDDISSEVREERDLSGGGEIHSESWFTVKELLDFDWTRETPLRLTVGAEDYYDWKFGDKSLERLPSEKFFQKFPAVSAPVEVDEKEMVRLLQEIIANKKPFDQKTLVGNQLGNYYCKLTLSVPYHALTSEFWSETIPQLLARGKPEDVRIVFWFDI